MWSLFVFLSPGLSLQEEPSLERGQSGYSTSCSRSGLGSTAGHWGTRKNVEMCWEKVTWHNTILPLSAFTQGDIQAKYESIDKDTPIPTDRQVTHSINSSEHLNH